MKLNRGKLFLATLMFACLVFIVTLIASLCVMGGGALLQKVAPLSLFEASLIFVTTFFAGTFAARYMLVYGSPFESDEVWDEGDAEVSNQNEKQVRQTASDKISRNQPCPCGSGKKYKYCCLKTAKTLESEEIPF